MIELTVILLLIGVAYEDYSSRLIHWWLFPLIATGLFGLSVIRGGLQTTLNDSLMNLGYLTLLLGTLVTMMAIRSGGFTQVLNSKIGWGDIWFLAASALGMSFSSFVLWVVIAAIGGLLVGVAMKILIRRADIPWAGIMAVILIVVLTIELTTTNDLLNLNLYAQR